VALGVVAGLLTARRTVFGHLVFWAMAAIGLVATVTRPDFAPVSLLPLAVGVVVWTVLLDYLTKKAEPQPTVLESRRRFLVNAGGVTVAALLVAAGGRLIGRSRRTVETARRLLRLPVTRGAVPAGADVPKISGMTPWRVPNRDFYRIDTSLVVPTVDPDKWRLRIHGMVDREITLTYRDLLARRLTEDWVTICCVSNPVGGDLIGNAWWSGVRVAELLHEAGVHPDADAVKQTSKNGWTCGTPITALTDGRNAMLAIGMNGDPLPLEHGFPVRMIVPGLYGYVSATKWLVDLEVTRFDRFSAYWTERGWSERGPVKTESRIEVPTDGAKVAAGRVRVGGHAWAQHTGIARVEYRLDGNAWRPAELGRVPGNDTWVQWAGTVNLTKGSHSLAVRATDRSGYTQTAARADVVPNGATGWHMITFDAA
jgi:DMSO/TMAO reductase YedYZ molybdopterin-dependent catalytic subunit